LNGGAGLGSLREQVAQLKSLIEGMQKNELAVKGELSNESKLYTAILDVINDMVIKIEDLQGVQEQQKDQIDSIDKELCEIENVIFDYRDDHEFYDNDYKYDEECPEYCGDYEEEDIFDDSLDDEQEIYMVECPYCSEIIELEKGIDINEKEYTLVCPKCKKNIDIGWLGDCEG